MAVFACIWNAAGIDLGWLFLVMGLLIGGAVFPAAFSITWAGQSRAGAIAGCICGLVSGIIAWLVTAQQYFGEITVSSTGREYATLAGNLAAIMTGLIVTVVVSLSKPQNFDWSITREINAKHLESIVSEQETPGREASRPQEAAKESKAAARLPISAPRAIDDQGKEGAKASVELPSKEDMRASQPTDEDVQADADLEEHPAKLKRAFVTACVAAFVLTFIMDFLVPIPMFLSHYVFSKGFFTAWVVISFLWVFTSTGTSVVLPIVETIGFLKKFAKAVFKR